MLLSEAGFEKVFRTQNWVRRSKLFEFFYGQAGCIMLLDVSFIWGQAG